MNYAQLQGLYQLLTTYFSRYFQVTLHLQTHVDRKVSASLQNTLKHFIDASREGDEDVRTKYNLNILVQISALFGSLLSFWILRHWFFPEFNPFGYWNTNGSFWNGILHIIGPAVAYGIFLGQLDWFSDDSNERGTLVEENIFFKGRVSFFAGLLEELSHRSVMIYFGLIAIWVSNFTFNWMIGFVMLILFIAIAAKTPGWKIDIVIFAIFLGLWLGLKSITHDNPIYILNGWIFQVYQWLAISPWLTGAVYMVLMAICLLITKAAAEKKGASFRLGPWEFACRIISFAIWAAYVLPLTVSALENIPIIPAGADKWTSLLYLGAILWSNAKFRDGHKYQGPAGMLNSYIFGFYMFYLAFSHGLIYAIVVHFLYDLVLLGSEHAVQVWKNRRLIYAKIC